jgi:integrase
MKGNRRKPYRVRITTGYEVTEDGRARQIQRNLGTYATYEEAVEALAAYNKNPVSLEPGVTFAEMYRRWSAEKYPTVSRSTASTYASAFLAVPMLHDREFRKLRRADLQHALDTCGKEYPTLEMICVVLRAVYKYALQNDIIDRDYSRFVDIARHKPEEDPEPIHRPFTDAEIAALWQRTDDATAREILMLIYSGLRIGEYLALTPGDIDMDARIVTVRAAKTRAGRRRVPIAAKTAAMWADLRAARAAHPIRNPDTAYTIFLPRMKDACAGLGISLHRPHDTRHTTATLLRLAGVDPYVTKVILGHATADITEKVYTHIPDSALIEAIDKI